MVLDGDVVPPPAPTDDDVTPPPVATVTPSPATAQPVSPGGTLQTVGLLPLAEGRYPVADRFAAKVRSAVSSFYGILRRRRAVRLRLCKECSFVYSGFQPMG